MSNTNTLMESIRQRAAVATTGDWPALTSLVAVAAAVALVVTIFTYYLVTDQFSGNGMYNNAHIGWLSSGSGVLVLLVCLLFATACAVAFGLSIKEKSLSLMTTVGISLLLSIVFYWVFDSGVAHRKFHVALWSAVSILGGLALALYGWYSLKSGYSSDSTTDKAQLAGRSSKALYAVIIAALLGIVLVYGMYKIHGATTASS